MNPIIALESSSYECIYINTVDTFTAIGVMDEGRGLEYAFGEEEYYINGVIGEEGFPYLGVYEALLFGIIVYCTDNVAHALAICQAEGLRLFSLATISCAQVRGSGLKGVCCRLATTFFTSFSAQFFSSGNSTVSDFSQ
jgi:hypothetical protein